MRSTATITCMCTFLLFILLADSACADTFYVAVNGSDDLGDGSAATPWATITHALDSVPDQSLVLVQPGTYTGRIRLRGTFSQGVTVAAQIPYLSRLRNSATVVTCYYGSGRRNPGTGGWPGHPGESPSPGSRHGHRCH